MSRYYYRSQTDTYAINRRLLPTRFLYHSLSLTLAEQRVKWSFPIPTSASFLDKATSVIETETSKEVYLQTQIYQNTVALTQFYENAILSDHRIWVFSIQLLKGKASNFVFICFFYLLLSLLLALIYFLIPLFVWWELDFKWQKFRSRILWKLLKLIFNTLTLCKPLKFYSFFCGLRVFSVFVI